MKDISESKSVRMWLNKAAGSETTARNYKGRIKYFFEHVDITPDELVLTWKKVKYDYKLREEFIDEWTERVEDFVYNSLENHTPLSRMKECSIITSFFVHNKIPIEPERKKHVYVKFHNRDISKKEIKRILEHASIRDRTFFLVMLESGLRPYTLVQLRYKHIKKDFEASRVPMMIELPSELLKDRVEARWTFIGRDGFRSLKEYLKPRLPLQNEDLIFIPERNDMKHDFLLPQTFTNKFGRIALELGITERREKGKPRRVRLYCLRKYFNNECRYEGFDPTFKEFWMGHKTTQTHYVSRNVERHREEYSKAYPSIRVYEPETTEEITFLKAEVEMWKKKAKMFEAKLRQFNGITSLLINKGIFTREEAEDVKRRSKVLQPIFEEPKPQEPKKPKSKREE